MRKAVTIIGLGPMGQAMAATYLDRGYQVTVWNRTTSKADALVAKGAHRAETVAEALGAGGPIILSLTDVEIMYKILEPAVGALPGRTLVNLSSDTPSRSRAAAEWAIGHGADYLSGGVQVPPTMIGSPESGTYYSGPLAVFEQHRETLEVITSADHRGEDQGLAALYYQLGMTIFWTNNLAYLQALAMAEANGISAAEFLPYAQRSVAIATMFMPETAVEVDTSTYPGELANMLMNSASTDHVLHTAAESGVDTTLPAAVADVFRRTVEAGHGKVGFASTFEVLRKQDA
ncbi:NAD(P)-dependent oxidoreductase [Crossiella cryophila]|uniref:3-hydroxyisobutyrate dehydrogenase-like beta-hydroxyacid dehydrogenase n=1 Tax=Crossiella cryophila TaxID=43355 RepID=A0A7W7C9X8_9PSEU|nr:NAD(P)-binding domain-containing protein [Crossiella cryophila]MBB4677117.1 3-hydroxyisobutyrate dehydrogenase-like beta-hydroxyacid dehydrogenase [Crossiella cryophila]